MNDEFSQSHTQPQAVFRLLRLIYVALFASVGAYWLVGEVIAGQAEVLAPSIMVRVVEAAAGLAILSVLVFRFQLIAALTATALRSNPAAVLARLRVLYIVCFALAEAVALYGLVLRLLGVPSGEATLFFLASAVLFLLCYPRLPR